MTVSLDPRHVARDVWSSAASRGPAPAVFELAVCHCASGGHSCHIVATHRPADDRFVVSTVSDMVAGPGVTGLAVWTQTVRPAGSQMLVVVASGRPLALLGSLHPSSPGPQVLEAVAGPLFTACLAALTPVPADDPLVVELAGLTGR